MLYYTQKREYGSEGIKMIREMEEKEMPAVLQLWLETNQQAHDFIPATYWAAQMPFVEKAFPQAEVYVLEQEGEIAGFLGLSGEYIEGIFVRQEKQSQGIGRALLSYAKTKKPRLTLSVYEKNNRARRFYQREGFLVEKSGIDANTGEAEIELFWERKEEKHGN